MSNSHNPPFTGEKTGKFLKTASGGVKLDREIAGCIVYPHRDGAQPQPDTTWSFEFGFRLPGKNVMFVKCTEPAEGKQAPDSAAAPKPVAASKRPVAPSAPAASAPKSRPAATPAQAKAHSHSGKKTHHAKPKRYRERDDAGDSRANAPVVDNTPGRRWEFGSDKSSKPATTHDCVDRAQDILKVKAAGTFAQSELMAVWAINHDEAAQKLRADITQMLGTLESFARRMKGPADRLRALDPEARDLADKLYHARNERERLIAEQKKLSGERIAATGKLAQAIKKAEKSGGAADPAQVAELERLKAAFAQRQSAQTAAFAANKLLLEGTEHPEFKRGLEHKVRWHNKIGGLLPLEEATARFDSVMADIAEVYTVHREMHTLKVQLAELVNAYDKRLAELAA